MSRVRSKSSKPPRASSGLSKRCWAKFTHRVDLYARCVLGDSRAGELITAGPYVRLACERHLRDRSKSIWIWSGAKADLAIAYYETVLRLPDTQDADGNAKPFRLAPAQVFIIGSLMGWQGPDGYRRFREGYVEMGKGNGKTPLLAGLGLYGLQMDGERAPEIYAAAVTRDQAKIMHRDAERMVDASPDLGDGVLVKTVNNLSYGLGFFRPFSRDQGMKSGPRPHMALVDEVHEHPSSEVINKLKAGFKFRKQPLAIYITNSGFDKTSICGQLHTHAENVVRGTVDDDQFFAYVCALDEGDDPLTDESCWPKVNPLLGVTITDTYLRRQVQNAKNIPAEVNIVLRLNFCVWTQAHTRAIDPVQWGACGAVVSDAQLAGEECFAGLDLGQSDDLSAFAKIWPLADGRVVVRMRYWIPEAAIKRFPNRPYDQWKAAGILEVTEGNTTDYDVVEAAIAADCEKWGVRELGYDNRFAEQMAQHLEGLGVTATNVQQGFGLNEAIRKLLSLIADQELCHGGDPMLGWMSGNVVLRHGTKGDVRLEKEKAPEKIDGFAALSNAIMLWVKQPPTNWATAEPELLMV